MKYEVRILRAAEKEMDKLSPHLCIIALAKDYFLLKRTPVPVEAENLLAEKNTDFGLAIIESYTPLTIEIR